MTRRTAAPGLEDQASLPGAFAQALASARAAPHYRDYPGQVERVADLRRLPLLTREDLKRGFPDRFLPAGSSLDSLLASDRLLRMHSSSGTTDERVEVLYDERLNSLPEGARRSWKPTRPLTIFSRIAVLTSPICAGFECHLDLKSFEERVRGRTLTCHVAANLVASRREDFLKFNEELERFRPDILLVNPIYALWLGRGLLELGVRPYSPALILSSYQWLLRTQRAFLKQAFAAPVYDYYSATDLGGAIIGYEDAAGRLAVNRRDVFLELLPPAGIPDQGRGYVVATTLRSRHMPLIRYLLGDLASVTAVSAGGEAIEAIRLWGRSEETFVLPSGALVTPGDVDDCLEEGDPLAAVELEEVRDKELVLHLHPLEPGASAATFARLAGRLRERLGPGFRLVPRLATRVELARSLKTWLCRPLRPLSRQAPAGDFGCRD